MDKLGQEPVCTEEDSAKKKQISHGFYFYFWRALGVLFYVVVFFEARLQGSQMEVSLQLPKGPQLHLLFAGYPWSNECRFT